jgi:hypothetical protein
MRPLLPLVAPSCALLLFAGVVGCSGGSAPSTAVESSEDFPAFAALLDAHLRDGEVDFLVDRMLTQHVLCTEADLDRQVGARYDCHDVGEEYDGFSYGAWATDGRPLLRRATVEEFLRQTFAGVRPDIRDNFGEGRFTVYAIDDGGSDGHRAVITGIVAAGGALRGQDLRTAISLQWRFEDGRWMLTRVFDFGVVFGSELLEPSSPIREATFPDWELFDSADRGG